MSIYNLRVLVAAARVYPLDFTHQDFKEGGPKVAFLPVTLPVAFLEMFKDEVHINSNLIPSRVEFPVMSDTNIALHY